MVPRLNIKINRTYLWLVMILLLGIAIRLYNPTFRSLWGDEAHSFYLAQQITPRSIIPVTINLIKESHLPVYFALLSAWMGIFGVSEYAMRSLSILIGIFGLIAFFFFSRKMFDEKTALISMFLLAFSPLAVMHSQEIRMYGFLFLLSTLSSLCFWELVSGKRSALNSAGYFISALLLVMTHIYGALIIAAQFVYLLFDYWRDRKTAVFIHLLILQILIGALAFPIYARMVFLNLFAVVSGTSDMAFSVFPWYLKLFLIFFVLSLGETVAPWNIWVVLPAALVFGRLFLSSFKGCSDKRIVFLLIFCLFPILVSAIFLKPTMPKYQIISLPFYLLLVGHSIALIEKRIIKYGIISLIMIVQFYSIYNYFNFRDYHNSNQMEPWREAAASIENQYRKGDIVLSSTHFVAYRLMNYYLNILNNVNAPIFDLEEVKINLSEKKPARIWFVTNIHDDQAFAPGYIDNIRRMTNKNYKLKSTNNYIPYEQTLVSKLPIKRHEAGSYRISVSLYERR